MSSSTYSDNIKHLPQRLPVALKWKDCATVKGLLVKGYYGLHIIPEGSKEAKHLRHFWNSYVKGHEKDGAVRQMLRRLSELDLLGHLTYGDTSVSFKTILTTYTPDLIRGLAQAEDEPRPLISRATLEQERVRLIKALEPGEVFMKTYGSTQMNAKLEANGTFTLGYQKDLSSFALLHIYKMKHDPMRGDIEEEATKDDFVALRHMRFTADSTLSLYERVRDKISAVKPPAPAPVVAPVVATPGPVISEEVRLKEKTVLAKLFKATDVAKKVFLRSIKVDCTAWLQPSGTFSVNQDDTGFTNLHSVELLHRKDYLTDTDLSQKMDVSVAQCSIYLETDTKWDFQAKKRLFEKNIRKHIQDLNAAEKKTVTTNVTSSANATASSAAPAKVEVAAEAKVEAPPAPAEAKVEVTVEAKVPAPAEAKVEVAADAPKQDAPLSLSVQLKALEEREAKLKAEVELLLFERKAKEQAVHQAKIRIAQLEADLAKIKADLA
jgi:hypothetical protein